MKKTLSLSTLICATLHVALWSSLEPLNLSHKVNDNNATIREFLSFCFVKTSDTTYCYAEAKLEGPQSIQKTAIIRIDTQKKDALWENIPLPLPSGTIISLFSLGSHLGILMVARELTEIKNWQARANIKN